jgi:hypothetical protein
MCLPQRHPCGAGDDRTKSEKDEFRRQLRLLPKLLFSCATVLSLRSKGDDYNSRAWCASEVCYDCRAVNGRMYNIVLRTDIEIGFVFFGMKSYNGKFDTLSFVEFDCCKRAGYAPLWTTPRAPMVFDRLKDLIMSFRNAAEELKEFQVEPLLLQLMGNVGLKCGSGSEADERRRDVILCGLLILQARNHGHPKLGPFFAECYSRFLMHLPLRVRMSHFENSFQNMKYAFV